MTKWPSVDIDRFRKIQIFLRVHTVYDIFLLLGSATFRTALNMV